MRRTTLVALVAHARDVRSDAREAFADALAGLAGRSDVVVLHTCQRVEVYLVGPPEARPPIVLREGRTDLHLTAGQAGPPGVPLPPPPPGTRRLEDEEAVRHLICVVCGLDSAVLGEEQVLHQVRQTLADRRAEGPLDGVLDRLFQSALHAGRRAHGWYPHPRPSLADAALDEIEKRSGPVAGQPVLVVGAGMMGRLAARAAARRGARVRVANRTPDRAAELARTVGGTVVPWGGSGADGAAAAREGAAADGALPPACGVIVAVGGRWPVGPAALGLLAAPDAVIADLSSPPALDQPVRARLGDRYLSVDTFAWRPAVGLGAQLQDRLDALVQDTGREYCRWLIAREGGPTLQRLTQAAEQRRRDEVGWLTRRLPDLPERELALIEQMSRRLVAGLLHPPRRAIHDDETGRLGRAARELFALPEEGAAEAG